MLLGTDQNIKPPPRQWVLAEVDPRFHWIWHARPYLVLPLWEGEADAHTWGPSVRGVQSSAPGGAMTWGEDKYGKQVEIVGTETAGYLDFGDTFKFPVEGEWTALCTFQLEEIGTDERSLFTKYIGPSNTRQLNWNVRTSGVLDWRMEDFRVVDAATEVTLTTGVWYTAAIRYHGTEVGQFIWEGPSFIYSRVGSSATAVTDVADNTGPVRLGARGDGGDNMRGGFAFAAVWDTAVHFNQLESIATHVGTAFQRHPSLYVVATSGADTVSTSLGTAAATGTDPTITEGGGNPPDQPTAQAPAWIAGTEASLQSSTYSELDGDAHVSSDWQVDVSGGDFSTPVWESLDDATNLESILIPAGTLSRDTEYIYRVRHTDSDGDSAWSASQSFSTTQRSRPLTPQAI